MLVYKFKITFEYNDDFERIVELKTSQSFLDFYNLLMENMELDKSLSASFYLCDHKFRKKKPIHLPGNKATLNFKNKRDEDEEVEEELPAVLTMDKCILSEFVDDPHQKFLFIYDLPNDWSFYIELMKIAPSESKATYPRIIKSLGPTPTELVKKVIPIPGLTDEEDEEFDEEYDDRDQSHIVGEEGLAEEVYGEEDLDDLNDDAFYNDSIELDSDTDETRQ
jgi:hypothetical protein